MEISVPGVEEQWSAVPYGTGTYPAGRLGQERTLNYTQSQYSDVAYSYQAGANCTFSVTAVVSCVDPECFDKWQYCINNDAGVGDNMFNLECDTYPEINPCIGNEYLYSCPISAEVTWSFKYFCKDGQMQVADVGQPTVVRSEPYSPCGTYECDLPPKPDISVAVTSSLSQCDCGPSWCDTSIVGTSCGEGAGCGEESGGGDEDCSEGCECQCIWCVSYYTIEDGVPKQGEMTSCIGGFTLVPPGIPGIAPGNCHKLFHAATCASVDAEVRAILDGALGGAQGVAWDDAGYVFSECYSPNPLP